MYPGFEPPSLHVDRVSPATCSEGPNHARAVLFAGSTERENLIEILCRGFYAASAGNEARLRYSVADSPF